MVSSFLAPSHPCATLSFGNNGNQVFTTGSSYLQLKGRASRGLCRDWIKRSICLFLRDALCSMAWMESSWFSILINRHDFSVLSTPAIWKQDWTLEHLNTLKLVSSHGFLAKLSQACSKGRIEKEEDIRHFTSQDRWNLQEWLIWKISDLTILES